MGNPAIEVGDVESTLDAVESLFAARRSVDAEMLVLAAHVADLHPAESVRAARGCGLAVRGRERAVRLRGERTPSVAEFCALELGARIQLGSWSAKLNLADALDVRHRLPLIWVRVLAHEARVPLARLVAARTRQLSREAAASVGRAMVEAVTARCRGAEHFAKRSRSSRDGTAGFYLRSRSGWSHGSRRAWRSWRTLSRRSGTKPLDLRRVKPGLGCATRGRGGLVAAFVAQLAGATDVELPLEHDDRADGESAGKDNDAGATGAPGPLDRMDAFGQRLGFTPTHLPRWLAVLATEPAPVFTFDWSRLLPSLTLNLHLAAEDLSSARTARGTV